MNILTLTAHSPAQHSRGCHCPSVNAAWSSQQMFGLMQMMQVMMSLMFSSAMTPMSFAPQQFGASMPAAGNPGLGSFLGIPKTTASPFSTPQNGNFAAANLRLNSSGWNQAQGARLGSLGSGNTPAAQALVSSIRNRPVPPRCRPGYCYRGVKYHVRKLGVNLHGGSAYQAAGQLARSDRFQEVQVSKGELRKLPAGAVVVWNRNNRAGKPHGHISIATGDGREASDKIRRQIVNYPSSFRVFLPK